mmetsp:Transcript_2328/g.3309  ORF Transcript_2328/g.3309 Transcript_2328/m.3309 type:complete len:208 (+) Transcript_2328:94-717(+)
MHVNLILRFKLGRLFLQRNQSCRMRMLVHPISHLIELTHRNDILSFSGNAQCPVDGLFEGRCEAQFQRELFILRSKFLCLVDHFLNLFLRQSPVFRCYFSPSIGPRHLVPCSDIEYPIRIQCKSHFNLGFPFLCLLHACDGKFPQLVISVDALPFPLVDDHVDRSLEIFHGGINTALSARNRRIPLYQGRHFPSFQLDSQGKWSHIQ